MPYCKCFAICSEMQDNFFFLCWKTQEKLTRGVVIISLNKQLFVNMI